MTQRNNNSEIERVPCYLRSEGGKYDTSFEGFLRASGESGELQTFKSVMGNSVETIEMGEWEVGMIYLPVSAACER